MTQKEIAAEIEQDVRTFVRALRKEVLPPESGCLFTFVASHMSYEDAQGYRDYLRSVARKALEGSSAHKIMAENILHMLDAPRVIVERPNLPSAPPRLTLSSHEAATPKTKRAPLPASLKVAAIA